MKKLLASCKILYDKDNLMQKRMAYRISQAMIPAVGRAIPYTAASWSRKKILLKDDESLAKGCWKITVEGQTATFAANTYYGYTGIAYYLGTARSLPFYLWNDGFEAAGDYRDDLPEMFYSNRFAFDKQGDVRVMFSNVLFFEMPTADRNELQNVMYGTYAPDVLGCQEFNRTKRHESRRWDKTVVPEKSLAALLAESGYVEAVDPVVRNAASVGDTFTVTDPIFGEITYRGYGGGKHPIEGYGYPTFLNMVPLFYRKATTKCLEAHYYWYRNQIDGQTCSDNDCGSKGITWGVFEDVATGKRYAVVNTHMCTRSNTVRALQAMEMVDLVNALVEKYDLPVFMGGDMNGTRRRNSFNVQTFEGALDFNDPSGASVLLTKEKCPDCPYDYRDLVKYQHLKYPFVNIQRTDIADYTAPFGTTHKYPAYNEELGMVQPNEGDAFRITHDEIDRVYLINGKTTKINLFGIVADECSLSSSDHIPPYVDFTFGE